MVAGKGRELGRRLWGWSVGGCTSLLDPEKPMNCVYSFLLEILFHAPSTWGKRLNPVGLGNGEGTGEFLEASRSVGEYRRDHVSSASHFGRAT